MKWSAIAAFACAALLSSCGPGSWEPWETAWGPYNLQFAEDTKVIITWVKAYGRVRERRSLVTGYIVDHDKQGVEYMFTEGDYAVDSTLRIIGNYRTIEKLEIVADQDSAQIILAEFKSDNTANFLWMDRRTGAFNKRVLGVNPGPYRLGEFQNRFYSGKTGPYGGVPPLMDPWVRLVTSVREWKHPDEYIVDIGVQPLLSPSDGIWEDFTSPNQYSPSTYFTFNDSENVMRLLDADTVFPQFAGTLFHEVWRNQDTVFGLYVSQTNSLTLIDTARVRDSIALSSIGIDSLSRSWFKYVALRSSAEIALYGDPESEVKITNDRFTQYVSRFGLAPDGVTQISGRSPTFYNPITGKTIVYVPPN